MAAKVRRAVTVPAPGLAEAPGIHRLQHTPFARDVLTPPGARLIVRQRARPLLTPFEIRRAIIEEAAEKPETVRVRSLRRRLTRLDRALSDQEAEALGRLTTCIVGLTNIGCINYLRSEVRSAPVERLPFSETMRVEIAAMNAGLKALSPPLRKAVLELAVILNPSHSGHFEPGEDFIGLLRSASAALVIHYDEWFRKWRCRRAAE